MSIKQHKIIFLCWFIPFLVLATIFRVITCFGRFLKNLTRDIIQDVAGNFKWFFIKDVFNTKEYVWIFNHAWNWWVDVVVKKSVQTKGQQTTRAPMENNDE